MYTSEREQEREGEREGGREGGKEGKKEDGREGGRARGREGKKGRMEGVDLCMRARDCFRERKCGGRRAEMQ